jgi:hypothetical protein
LSVIDDDLAALYRAAKAVAKDTVAFKKETNEDGVGVRSVRIVTV